MMQMRQFAAVYNSMLHVQPCPKIGIGKNRRVFNCRAAIHLASTLYVTEPRNKCGCADLRSRPNISRRYDAGATVHLGAVIDPDAWSCLLTGRPRRAVGKKNIGNEAPKAKSV